MELHPLIRRLASIAEPEGTVVTVALDVSKSGILPPATRIFLKDQVLENLASEARPLPVQGALRKIARRLRDYVERGLRPGTNGVFIVAGRTVWEAVELMIPLRNLIHVGRAPYLAPLLEARARSPRAFVVRVDGRGTSIDELDFAGGRRLAELDGPRVVEDVERRTAVSGRGGTERDRHDQRCVEASHRMLREAAATIVRLESETPAEAVLFFGDREHVPTFREHLSGKLRERLVHAGAPPRNEHEMRDWARLEVERRARGKLEEEIEEFTRRREQGCFVALGPRDVLEQLPFGTVARVFVDPYDPIPGMACLPCAARFPGLRERCPYCWGELVAVSMTQELIAHALAHPPLAITHVSPPAPWLAELGGMAALLSSKGARTKTVKVG